MDRYALVAVFGAAGAVSRYAVDSWVGGFSRGEFPWGILAINVAGSLAIGVLVGVVADTNWRLALGVGFLGAFTTFSTYAYDSIRLAEDSAYGLAFLNVAGTVVLGLAAAFAGLKLGRAL